MGICAPAPAPTPPPTCSATVPLLGGSTACSDLLCPTASDRSRTISAVCSFRLWLFWLQRLAVAMAKRLPASAPRAWHDIECSHPVAGTQMATAPGCGAQAAMRHAPAQTTHTRSTFHQTRTMKTSAR